MGTDGQKSKETCSTSDSALIDECRALRNDIDAKLDQFRDEIKKLNSKINKITSNEKD
jgi:hypothetical protein